MLGYFLWRAAASLGAYNSPCRTKYKVFILFFQLCCSIFGRIKNPVLD
jgi:hypothetical protein